MFLLLSKLLPVLVYPASLAGLLLLAGLRAPSRRWRNRLFVSAALVLWVLGNGWVAEGLVRSLEWRYLPLAEYPAADAIVILGGVTSPVEYPRDSVEVSGGGDRVLYGADLYKRGLAPVIVLTGGNLPWTDAATDSTDEMRELLLLMGIPADAILAEEVSANTYENALFTRELLEPLGMDRIILVTSALHMPRSAPLFENQGFTVIPAPTDYNATRTAGTRPLIETWPDLLIGLFPSAGAMGAVAAVMKEYIGIAVYWLRGWY